MVLMKQLINYSLSSFQSPRMLYMSNSLPSRSLQRPNYLSMGPQGTAGPKAPKTLRTVRTVQAVMLLRGIRDLRDFRSLRALRSLITDLKGFRNPDSFNDPN